jgi:hypothetical protein
MACMWKHEAAQLMLPCSSARGRSGAKFAKLKVRYDAEQALTKYEPFIVISKNFP